MLDALLSPWALGLLGLMVGSFLNVVIHRMPRMFERQWWADVAGQLADRESFRRVFEREAPAGLDQAANSLDKAIGSLKVLNLAYPASRCVSCGHVIRWYENIPVVSWLWLKGRPGWSESGKSACDWAWCAGGLTDDMAIDLPISLASSPRPARRLGSAGNSGFPPGLAPTWSRRSRAGQQPGGVRLEQDVHGWSRRVDDRLTIGRWEARKARFCEIFCT